MRMKEGEHRLRMLANGFNRLDVLRRELRERRRAAKELIEHARSICAKAAQSCEESRRLQKKFIANLSGTDQNQNSRD
jgi:hypothetical protein